tara:strand:- start:7 stop:744 length:738 start_codon:yes stop_codon:yes gene_type:complete
MEIYNDDCFNVFPKIADKTIDLFVLDLPYANKDFGKCTACKWDNTIDLDKMWVEIKRIMKPNAVILFYCNTKFGFSLIKSNIKWFRYDLIWKKSKKVGFLSCNRAPLRQHENIYVFKDKGGTYNPQKTEGIPYKTTRKGKVGVYNTKRTDTENKGDRHPTSIYPDTIETTILEHNNPHKTLHRTQKPLSLCEWLIKTYSNEGDVVMDFTMGSGTTGEACINTKRKFIGVEMDKEIFEIAENRLNL